MSYARITLAALVALSGLTACAMKEDGAAARRDAPALAVETVTMEPTAASAEEANEAAGNFAVEDRFAEIDVKNGPAPAKLQLEKPGFADEAEPVEVDDLLGALDDTDNDMDYVPDPAALPRIAESPPPPPPEPMPEPALAKEVQRLDSARGYAWDAKLDDGEVAAQGFGGLGLRGSGAGGGGTGEGLVAGLGELDKAGGKGYGRGPGGGEVAGKKKRKARRQMPRKPKPQRAPARTISESSIVLGSKDDAGGDLAQLFDDAEEPVEEEREESEKKAEERTRFRADLRQQKQAAEQQARRDADARAEVDAMLMPLDGKDVDGRFQVAEYPQRFVQPDRFIPRMCYFENTYLGGNAAYTERLRRLDDALPRGRQPYRAAALPRQPFDAPDDAGLALTATLDRAYVDQPQRVFLQVGLQGSKRFGWRRPPLDIALVVDGSASDGETLVEAITALSRRLGPQDRLGVIVAAPHPIVLGELAPLRDRLVLARAIEALGNVPAGPPGALAAAMNRAGGMLQAAAGESARIPGTQTVLVLTRDANQTRIDGARGAAHALTVQGAVTSVIQLGGSHQGWWQVANAGHGNYHRATDEALADAVDDELSSISKVIARLLRVNVKLADGVEAIRVVGSRVLGQQEVKQVKAREEATDRNLSKTMGVKADRGDDDDGIQTVIPYFYGGDSHVILLELWVTRPGPVAEISLKYKDMVALQNATARVAAQLDRVPRDLTPAERRVAANVRGFQLAEGLAAVAGYAERGDRQSALDALDALDRLAVGRDQRLVDAFADLVQQRGADRTVAEALRMAHDRRIGHSP